MAPHRRGLSRTQQDELWKRVAPLLLPTARRPDKKPPSPQEAAEVWRAVAACERIEAKKKAELGDVLIGLIEKRRSEAALWSLGRLGRMPLYGPIDNTVAPVVAGKWLARLMALPIAPEKPVETAADKSSDRGSPKDRGDEAYAVAQAAAELARLTGDRVRDLADADGLRGRLAAWLKQSRTRRRWRAASPRRARSRAARGARGALRFRRHPAYRPAPSWRHGQRAAGAGAWERLIGMTGS